MSLACIALSSCGSARATSLTSTNILCSKSEYVTSVTRVIYNYGSYIDATGTAFINCSVVLSGGQFSNSVIYKSTQTGALTGACTVYAGINGGTFGSWAFTSQSGVTSALYSDSLTSHTHTFASSDCSTN